MTEHVNHVLSNDAATENARAVQRLLARGYDFRHAVAPGLPDVHRNDAFRRCIEIAKEIKPRSFVTDEPELIFKIGNKLLERRIGGVRRIANQYLVLRIGAARDRKHEVL